MGVVALSQCVCVNVLQVVHIDVVLIIQIKTYLNSLHCVAPRHTQGFPYNAVIVL